MTCKDCADHDDHGHYLSDAMAALTDQLGRRDDNVLAAFAELNRRPSPVAVEASNRIVTGNIQIPYGTIDPVLLVPAARDRLRVTITASVLVVPDVAAYGFVSLHSSQEVPMNRTAAGNISSNNQTGYMLRCANETVPYQFQVAFHTAAAIYASNVGVFPMARIDYLAEFLDPLQ